MASAQRLVGLKRALLWVRRLPVRVLVRSLAALVFTLLHVTTTTRRSERRLARRARSGRRAGEDDLYLSVDGACVSDASDNHAHISRAGTMAAGATDCLLFVFSPGINPE